MKFLSSKASMIEVFSIAQEVISTKNVGSILSSVLIIVDNNITIKATDLKINYEAQITAEISEPGNVVVYCNKFIEILNSFSLNEEIEFFQEESKKKNEEDNLIINMIIKPTCGGINFQIRNTPCQQFHDFSIDKNISYFKINSKSFKEMIEQTLFAVSVEESRHFMNGVFFEKKENNLNLVATDGRRLSFISKQIFEEVKEFPSVIVHPKILNIILKYAPNEGNVLIAVDEKNFFCNFLNYKFSSTLLEGQFPNYTRVIPKKQQFVFYVKKIDLANALNKHILLMLDRKIGRIYFNISQDILKITALHPDIGSVDEEISCDFLGVPCTIAFNFRYIEEPLNKINTETIAFNFTEEMKAVTMRPEPAQDYFHIIMPMQKE